MIPKQWKIVVTVPVHKKGKLSDPNNYRPISLTSPVCRLMERIIADRVRFSYDYLIIPNQFGFMKKRSCNLALLESISQWQSTLHDRKPVDVIYFDFKKAFDMVPHRKLLMKLKSLGFDEMLIKWYESFLNERKSVVKVGDCLTTETLNITSGVLQGTVSGPLLFLFFVNDICLSLPNTVDFVLFADDIEIYSNIPCELQLAVNNIVDWSIAWSLPIAPHKTSLLRLGRNNVLSPYFVENVNIPSSVSIRDLGVIIDEKLKFESHINSKVALANVKASQILRAFRFTDAKRYISLFNVYVRPILEYCSEVFNPPPKSRLCSQLESPLRKFTKTVCLRCKIPYVSYSDRLAKLDTQSSYCRIIGIDLLQAHKILHGKSHLVRCPFVLSRNVRHRLIRQPRTYRDENWYFTRVERYWNMFTRNENNALSLGKLRMNFENSSN